MCTVTVVPARDGYIFTFSRDEAPGRYTAQFTAHRQLPHKEIFFAKDSRAGGSWFVADNLGNVAMLFNGAFQKHQKKENYVKSRGAILLELFSAADMKRHFEETGFNGVEPFSIILFEHGVSSRLTWDGVQKHVTVLLREASYIFSSATLYKDEAQAARRNWLAAYLKEQPVVNSDCLFAFHALHKKDDDENGLVIKRPGGCSTLSISQAVVKPGQTILQHMDLVTRQIFKQQIFKS